MAAPFKEALPVNTNLLLREDPFADTQPMIGGGRATQQRGIDPNEIPQHLSPRDQAIIDVIADAPQPISKGGIQAQMKAKGKPISETAVTTGLSHIQGELNGTVFSIKNVGERGRGKTGAYVIYQALEPSHRDAKPRQTNEKPKRIYSGEPVEGIAVGTPLERKVSRKGRKQTERGILAGQTEIDGIIYARVDTNKTTILVPATELPTRFPPKNKS